VREAKNTIYNKPASLGAPLLREGKAGYAPSFQKWPTIELWLYAVAMLEKALELGTQEVKERYLDIVGGWNKRGCQTFLQDSDSSGAFSRKNIDKLLDALAKKQMLKFGFRFCWIVFRKCLRYIGNEDLHSHFVAISRFVPLAFNNNLVRNTDEVLIVTTKSAPLLYFAVLARSVANYRDKDWDSIDEERLGDKYYLTDPQTRPSTRSLRQKKSDFIDLFRSHQFNVFHGENTLTQGNYGIRLE